VLLDFAIPENFNENISFDNNDIHLRSPTLEDLQISCLTYKILWGAFDSAQNHKRQRRKRQSVTAKREKSQTPKFV